MNLELDSCNWAPRQNLIARYEQELNSSWREFSSKVLGHCLIELCVAGPVCWIKRSTHRLTQIKGKSILASQVPFSFVPILYLPLTRSPLSVGRRACLLIQPHRKLPLRRSFKHDTLNFKRCIVHPVPTLHFKGAILHLILYFGSPGRASNNVKGYLPNLT